MHTLRAAELLTIFIEMVAPTASCPLCGSDARRVHSRYTRQLADLPCFGYAVRLRLAMRRFFARVPIVRALLRRASSRLRRSLRSHRPYATLPGGHRSRPGRRPGSRLVCSPGDGGQRRDVAEGVKHRAGAPAPAASPRGHRRLGLAKRKELWDHRRRSGARRGHRSLDRSRNRDGHGVVQGPTERGVGQPGLRGGVHAGLDGRRPSEPTGRRSSASAQESREAVEQLFERHH